jgi:lipopolysaccharide transport system permease protein
MLGAAWTVIKPLAMIIVYTVVFAQVMQSKLPGIGNEFAYSIYLCAGLLTWNYFSEAVNRGQNVFLENANLLKKVNFPVLSLSVIALANATVNFAIIFGLFSWARILCDLAGATDPSVARVWPGAHAGHPLCILS